MAFVCATPHGEAIAEADHPADFAIQRDAASEPGVKMAERENDVALASNLVDGCLGTPRRWRSCSQTTV